MIGAARGKDPVKVLKPVRIFQHAQLAFKVRKLRAAARLYSLAESCGYDADACAAGRWLCHALRGDFLTAWQESDLIEQRGKPDRNRFWNGRPLNGQRVLVRCLHGLGDTIQFVRYLPLLRQIAASVTLEAQPLLKPLLFESGLADRVITWGESEGCWDQQIEIVELPRIFRTTIETIPSRIPYLTVSSNAPRRPSPPVRVAFVWAASTWDSSRSVPLPLLSRICHLPGFEFFSLQAGEDRAELAACSAPILDFFDPAGSVLSAARRLMSMHLLITVDTMMAHLAGALGLPVWTLLPAQADWRWMLARPDSPWYPTMRLFRQDEPGRWEPVIRQLESELPSLLQPPRGGFHSHLRFR
jgi:hypothetical protein